MMSAGITLAFLRPRQVAKRITFGLSGELIRVGGLGAGLIGAEGLGQG